MNPIPELPANASKAARRRFRRNVVILAAHRAGISERVLADVFGLPRQRVAAIIKKFSGFSS